MGGGTGVRRESERPLAQIRTGVAAVLLVGGKLLNVQVPYMFKLAIDTMSVASTEPVSQGCAS